jgi:hypothetical protein
MMSRRVGAGLSAIEEQKKLRLESSQDMTRVKEASSYNVHFDCKGDRRKASYISLFGWNVLKFEFNYR